MSVETRSFQAEVQQVLHLVIHSLYSHKEIFLRELISNASDALDKLRFAALQRPELNAQGSELRIELELDREARTLTIRDNGIGMSYDEVVDNLGTIARSGTKRFLESLSGDARKDSQLIGQFGVGFYSAFIVADQVEVRSRRADLEAAAGVIWRSEGKGEYAIEQSEREARGTEIVLRLKAEEDEFLSPGRIESLIHKYSDHIGFAIKLWTPAEGENAEPGSGEWRSVNQASALWTRNKNELKDEDYQSFFQHLTHGSGEALGWSHNRVEGNQSYTLLLYVPKEAPYDLMWGGRDERHGLKLYVRRVYIMDAAEQLLPAYLRFVRGVVDSDDLPLNVSREILQDNKLVSQIRSACIKRTLDFLDKLAQEDKDKYQGFWNAYGHVLKEGLTEDYAHRDKLAKLVRFASTRQEGAAQTVSLDDYIAGMRPNQTEIYYITAESHLAARHSPHLEACRAKGVEVLLLSDRIDEWAIGYLNEYQGKPLVAVSKGELKLDAVEDLVVRPDSQRATLDADFLKRVGEVLGERVREVQAGTRLRESAACLVVERYDMALHTQRLLKQAGQGGGGGGKPALELNPEHALVQRMSNEADPARFEALALLAYEQALLAEGGQLEDPSGFIHRLNSLLFSKAA